MLPASRLDAAVDFAPDMSRTVRGWPWRQVSLFAGTAALSIGLVWAGLRWPAELASSWPGDGEPSGVPGFLHPWLVLAKLGASALIGLLITAIHKDARIDKPLSRSMEQAQTLLCVSGAVMMIIIGNSLARAFGIAGAAAIIRFRTPVDDPRDITILFLLMALGMASGLGAFALAGLGTVFLCVLLLALGRAVEPEPRTAMLELVAAGADFPSDHVRRVLGRHKVAFEAREIALGDPARARYHATLDQALSLDDLSYELVEDGQLKSVSWNTKKNGVA